MLLAHLLSCFPPIPTPTGKRKSISDREFVERKRFFYPLEGLLTLLIPLPGIVLSKKLKKES